MKKLIDSAFILATITSCLYCAYSSYFAGFANYLDISYELLDKNINQSLFFGTNIVLAQLILFVSVFIISIRFLYYLYRHILTPYVFDKFKIFVIIKNESKIYNENNFIFNIFTNYLFVIFLILLAVTASLIFFQEIGKNRAFVILNKIKTSNDSELITINIDNQIKKLYLITCGERMCVGYDKKNNTMNYFQSNKEFYQSVQGSKFIK